MYVMQPSNPVVVAISTSELFIRVRDSTVIFVTPPSNPVVVVITTSEVSIRVRGSTVTFVNQPSHLNKFQCNKDIITIGVVILKTE